MKKAVITTIEVKAAIRALGKRTMTGRARRKLVRQLKQQKMLGTL
jgi:hypothetical protein